MTEVVDLYGFGSFFSTQGSTSHDLDILVLHERIDDPSINFAIQCKAAIRTLIQNADVVILSKQEEEELAFVRKCNGRLLGQVTDNDLSRQLEVICRTILGLTSEVYDSRARGVG
jgi:hypothetical protein